MGQLTNQFLKMGSVKQKKESYTNYVIKYAGSVAQNALSRNLISLENR